MVQLRKDNPDGSEEYVSQAVMRDKQLTALQNSEIDVALNQAFPEIQEKSLRNGRREGLAGWLTGLKPFGWTSLDISH